MSARLIGVLAAMAALLGAGLATGTRVYYALLALLALMLVYALASVLWTLFTARVSLKGVKPRVLRGDRLTVLISVSQRSLLPAAGLQIYLSVPGGAQARQQISVSISPFARRVFRSVVACPHRGQYELGVARLAAADLFGLFEFSRASGQKCVRVEVCPRAAAAALMPLTASDSGPEFRSRASEDAASPSGIRKWQDGDELKKIHWKLSLRKREMMVRTFEESARPDTLVIPDLSALSALDDQRLALEDCICEASLGAARAQLEGGFPVRMPLEAKRPQELSGKTAADLPIFSDALMRVAFDGPYPYEKILTLMLQRMQRTGGAVLVTARLTTRVADIAMRMQRGGIQVRLIWVADAPKDEALEMLERLKMSGAQVERADPWQPQGGAAARPEARADTNNEGTLFDI